MGGYKLTSLCKLDILTKRRQYSLHLKNGTTYKKSQ